MGEISVRISGAWHAARCVRAEVHGVPLRTWAEAAAELRRVNADVAALTAPIVMEAIRAIEAMSAGAQMREGIADRTPTEAQIDHLERSLLHGFHLPDPAGAAAAEDPLSGGIPVTGARGDAVIPETTSKPAEPTSTPGAMVAGHPPAADTDDPTPPIDDDFGFED